MLKRPCFSHMHKSGCDETCECECVLLTCLAVNDPFVSFEVLFWPGSKKGILSTAVVESRQSLGAIYVLLAQSCNRTFD